LPVAVSEQDQVRLAIPAMPEFVRLARLTVAGLASRMGFTFDEVEDLRIAVDEQCHWLMGGQGHGGMITLTCGIGEDLLIIEGSTQLGPQDDLDKIPDELSELSRLILDSVVDAYACAKDGGHPSFRLEKRKAR
jgi:serine/threonine-protein kinase RsbW